MSKTLVALLAVSLLACHNDNKLRGESKKKPEDSLPKGSLDSGATESFRGAERVNYQVDIIFLLDGSDSMDSKIDKTVENLDGLIKNYLGKVNGLDYQIIIAGDRPFSVSGPRVGRFNKYVTSRGSLTTALEIISGAKIDKTDPSGPEIAVRKTAVKELVVVSDDNSEIDEATFIKWMDTHMDIASVVYVNGIICNIKTCGGFLGIGPKIGTIYMDLSNNPRTKGIIGDICQYNNPGAWQGIFDNLGNQLAQFKKAPAVMVKLSAKPTDPSQIIVKINGTQVDATLVKYDPATNQLLINKETSSEDVIDVVFN